MKLSTLFPHCQKPETFGLRPPFFSVGLWRKPAHPLALPACASRGQHHSAESPQGFAALGAWDNFPLASTTVRLALLSSSRLGALELCLPSEGAWLTSRLDSICSAQAHRKCWRLKPLHFHFSVCWTLWCARRHCPSSPTALWGASVCLM